MIALYAFVFFLILCVLNLFVMVYVHNNEKYNEVLNAFKNKQSIGQNIFDFAVVNMYMHGFYSIKSFMFNGPEKMDRALKNINHWIYKYTIFCFFLYTFVFLYVLIMQVFYM